MWLVLWLNLAVALTKAAFAWWAQSLAVGTDALHSFLDAGANVIGLVALRLAHAPADPEHPYGHRKFEVVAAAAVGVVIAVGVVEFGSSAFRALLAGRRALETPVVGFVVVGGTWIVNMFVATYEARKASELGSPFLAADAGHTASDVVVTAAVLASLVAGRLGIAWADAGGALLVLVFVARVAWRIVKDNLAVLVDSVALEPEQVRTIALATPGVRGCHRVRSRGTEGSAHVDLHILVDGECSLRRAHAVAHAVEDRILRELPHVVDVVIHMEPDGDEPEAL